MSLKRIILLFTIAALFTFPARGDYATVFIYHRFGDNRYPTTSVSMEDFKKQMEFLKKNNYNVVSPDELWQMVKSGRKIPPKTVVITIDDGYRTTMRAFKVLKEYNFPFTVFLYMEAIGRYPDFLTIEEIKKLKNYDENEAGSLMQTELFSAQAEEKVGQAIERLKKLRKENGLENIHHVFLTDKFGYYVGSMPLEDVITFDFNESFEKYFSEQHKMIQPVKATDPVSDVVKLFEDYDLVVLPVVDSKNRLIGRITSDDIVDVIEDRATEQIYKMAGVDEESEEERDIGAITKKRAIWLGVNLLTAILASFVIGLFDDTIKTYVALAVLMPIVASMGGNAGTQSLTVMVRQLALGEIGWSESRSAILREFTVSLLNGVIFAIVMGLIAFLWFNDTKLGIVIGIAMVINLIFAGLFGSLIPLGLKRIGVDPAVASSVLLTTVTDVVGFFAFLGLAKLILV